MADSIIPERPIAVSPSLAASIGLEEAILLQHLQSVLALGDTQTRQGYCWATIHLLQLNEQLPFWTAAALRRILQNLVDLGMVLVDHLPDNETARFELAINQKARHTTTHQKVTTASFGAQRISTDWQPDAAAITQLQQQGIEHAFATDAIAEFVLYWQERGETSHAWSSKFLHHVTRRWQTYQQHRAATTNSPSSKAIEKQWQPSLDAREILQRMGIHNNFIDDSVAEFILYWQERGEAQTTWNSKFVTHVKRQWAHYTHTLKHDTEPRAINENWVPDHEVFDVLTIANIDGHFARELIPEFILYWRDKNTLHHSWNTKFLQHVKYRWARRNDQRSKGDAFDRLTDRSWAADLV